ncbi:MAG TPA: RNA polymerase factor sigma-32 [Anaeromyxobacteraceae bacterium]|nr:RNA polymerase factor sigma-32 [Anaeromyxobacteraceae bacterium]
MSRDRKPKPKAPAVVEAEVVEPEVVEPEPAEPEPTPEDEAPGAALDAGDAAPVDVEIEPSVEVEPAAERETAGSATSLARSDPLRAYMAEVSRHPVLSREEEQELADLYARTGDRAAAWKLVTANLRLVVKIAREYHRGVFQLLDLIQEGNVGLMQAVKKYDPLKGVKLSTYAAWWIRAYIIRFIMDNWRQVKLGTTQAQRKLFFNLSKERERLIARGIEPTPRLLARNLRVDEEDVNEMTARMAGDDLSLDAPLRGEDGDSTTTRLDRLEDEHSAGADETVAADQLRRMFREKLDAFAATLEDEREKAIFADRLLPPEGQEPATLADLGARFGLTRERARQIEAKLTARLREYVKSEIPDFDLLGPE